MGARKIAKTSAVLLCGLALIAGPAICGCGRSGGGVSDDTSAQPKAGAVMITPKRFSERAQAICRHGNEERGQRATTLLERRAEETGESLGLVGEFEQVQGVLVPSLAKEIRRLEMIGLPEKRAYEAEALWQTLRIVLHEVEVEGLYAWRSATLLRPFRKRARPFGLDSCIVN